MSERIEESSTLGSSDTMSVSEDYVDPSSPSPASPPNPIAFISYSHDSKEHKAWVAAFAVRLVKDGIDVMFDGFDVRPGDDVVKYMERSVVDAQHVLMICTETYVRKADDGKGGAGYEVMIVTGELVRNLGTGKFIPVIRQNTSDPVSPRCVSTRHWINLSEGPAYEEEYDKLRRHLHEAPKLRKPPIGPNPYAKDDLAGETSLVRRERRRTDFASALFTPEATYDFALQIMQDDDQVTWRRLLRAAVDRAAELTRKWMKENPEVPPNTRVDFAQLLQHAHSGLACFESLISCLLAAAESGREAYSGQLGWIDEIRQLPSWPESGLVYWVNFRDTVLFVAQALVGGKMLEIGDGETAYKLATTKIHDRYNSNSLPIYRNTSVNGWPNSLAHTCTIAWNFLDSIIESWSVVRYANGSPKRSKEGIAAYYLLLDFLAFVSKAKEGAWNIDPLSGPITVPQLFFVWPQDIVNRGYQCFLRQMPLLRRVLKANKIDDRNFEILWKLWHSEIHRWLTDVLPTSFLAPLPNNTFPTDLRRDDLVL